MKRAQGIVVSKLAARFSLPPNVHRPGALTRIHFRNASSTAPASSTTSGGSLDGIRILDLSRAPYCTQILADYGADVIKVEDVARGDDTRHWKISGEESAWNPEAGPMSQYFASVNRNKRSICLNLKSEKGREVFLKLAAKADLVVENFRPGAMDRLGLGYDALKSANPRLIYASVSGYGSSGPYSKKAGYDMTVGAEAGLLHVTGERNGPPVRPGLGLVDMCTGLYTHGAILAALYARQQTGRGQKVEVSLFETQIALLINVALSWLNLGKEAERWGTQHPSVVPYDAFKTRDLYFVCGATNDKQFSTLCKVLGDAALSTDERFSTNTGRVQNRDQLFPILNDLFSTKTTEEWLQDFEGSGLPYAPINTMEKVFSHPQTRARDMVKEIAMPTAKAGRISVLGPAVKFTDTPASIRTRPPLLGEHSEEILKEIGVTDNEIEELKNNQAVGFNPGSSGPKAPPVAMT
ncbi:uncharacterized protein A1O5_02060 [Cladophialophora psammophila CBS 110553]|uniref:Alpha-methylacyl-CoA racemase n=1 Tax=Cladophialophora psammophila CBS 110553 TaxID=1182543 RepID=W9XYN0_9EURO|nr:uncharacterized protein A1O5_02060 [Cladophialophora psammophila CBS 110553]EXJ75364.1 hypothetical protein A1O5_02060 [Cladophialophora psammophila CBS 110553]